MGHVELSSMSTANAQHIYRVLGSRLLRVHPALIRTCAVLSASVVQPLELLPADAAITVFIDLPYQVIHLTTFRLVTELLENCIQLFRVYLAIRFLI